MVNDKGEGTQIQINKGEEGWGAWESIRARGSRYKHKRSLIRSLSRCVNEPLYMVNLGLNFSHLKILEIQLCS